MQITTDGHRPYLEAIDFAFQPSIDYAMLVKIYGQYGGGDEPPKRYQNLNVRYSQGECVG